MRKIFLLLTLIITVSLTGCGKKITDTYISEDYQTGNNSYNRFAPIMKTEKGYYYYDYYNRLMGYYDNETKKNIPLCNKPECRHDGNEFCVASNSKYDVLGVQLYSGKLFINAYTGTDTNNQYKLLTASLDGSTLSEIVTYIDIDGPIGWYSSQNFYIHRNKVYLPYSMGGEDGEEAFEGLAIYNLDTRELTYFHENPLSKENVAVTDLQFYENYFFYCQKDGRKTYLYRHNLEDDTTLKIQLDIGFQGNYVVKDENTIFYTKNMNGALIKYDVQTMQSEECLKFEHSYTFEEEIDGELFTHTLYANFEGTSLMIQDGLLYAGCSISITKPAYFMFDSSFEWRLSVHVYDLETFEEVSVVEQDFIGDGLQLFHFVGDDIYVTVNDKNDTCVYKCNKDDYINGTRKLEKEFTIGVHERTE